MSTSESNTVKELRKFIKHRASIKASVLSIHNYVNLFNPSVHSFRQLQIRLNKLNELIDTFNNIQYSIMDLDQGFEEEEERIKFEDDCFTLKANMEDLILKNTPVDAVNTSHSMHSTVGDNLRLPTIQIPTFNGCLEDWSSFIDTFNALFHNNVSLNDVQRLHYLKTSVTGAAADIIKNFAITADNYQPAYNELIRQYENKGLTIQTHIRSLLDSPKVISPSASDLRKLHHHVASHVRALKALGQPVQFWDAWLVTLICKQLDPMTAGEWQLRLDSKELPTYEQIESFLSKRVLAYEIGANSLNINEKTIRSKPILHNNKSLFIRTSNTKDQKCPVCSSPHKIYACDTFNKMTVPERKNVVQSANLCFNCLNFGHQIKTCKFSSCPKCNLRHNSKLHEDNFIRDKSHQVVDEQQSTQNQTVLCTSIQNVVESDTRMNVMLSTAIVQVYDEAGQPQFCRAVLDSGSQLNFITKNCAQRLGLSSRTSSLSIAGIGAMSSQATQLFHVTLSSRYNNSMFNVTLHSLPVIVDSLPTQAINKSGLNIPKHIKNYLADPSFSTPAVVDILLGSEIFFNVLGEKRWKLSNHASLYHTKLGWIFTGKLPIANDFNKIHSVSTSHDSALSFFISKSSHNTAEEIEAENHFQSTYTRNSCGRFIVKLPLHDTVNSLGESRAMALKRFYNLERRLAKDKSLSDQYNAFMNEYLKLGHMELSDSEKGDKRSYYLPHHPVFKENSITTKVRVVFDGSAVTKSGLSLNDVLLKGPKVQPDIVKILWRFRIHNVVVTADVAKMYRQILVAPEDCNLQRICFRGSPDQQVKDYNLKTVTYGTKSASFLATRCLVQIAEYCDDPIIKRTILQDFYVDDLLSGGESDEQCFHIYKNLKVALDNVGFPLRKWCSNSSTIMNRIPNTQNDPTFMLRLSEEETVSALGLMWKPSVDSFCFVFKDWSPPFHMTKRKLLSDINSVYDPVGLITPVLIKGKIFLQQLWSLKIDWDEKLSENLQTRWTTFYSSLRLVAPLLIPRQAVCVQYSSLEIHGFCDASQEAFGACIYIRTISNNDVKVSLFTSKSRVAPLKSTTIPRLELSGALLLAELFYEVFNELKCLNIVPLPTNIYFWTDSKIVLAWIKSDCLFQAFVANRIARIQDVTIKSQWNYVPTAENPADLITRGVDATLLRECTLWWNGPQWLKRISKYWPSSPALPKELLEVRPVKLVLVVAEKPEWFSSKFSNWMLLTRVTALVFRFIFNCRSSLKMQQEKRRVGFITILELNEAQMFWIAHAQDRGFPKELALLRAEKMVHRGSCLTTLNPFLDTNGIIRVGGRLENAAIPYGAKHPMVLPFNDRITKLIFDYEHHRLMHLGPQALLAHISLKFWTIRGRVVARKTVRQCMPCFRARPSFSCPFMAPLPRERVTVTRPFAQTGVDYCGPIMVRSGIRRVIPRKSYICVFICMVTRAVHLELVSSLSTEDFIAALSRFIARRGPCSKLFSDNGTNFVGANRILKSQFLDYSKSKPINDILSSQCIEWHFIPPAAPHFGGLWEAAVQSAKRHLLRVAKGIMLTYDETTTLLCKIEAALNSRPLVATSSDPADLNVLTPGHFLIGGMLMQPPEPDTTDIPLTRQRRFKLVQTSMQLFWKRWKTEYLPQIQRRNKWTKLTRNAAVGDIAILKDDTSPPINWPLVRVVQIHPGADGIVRTVTLRNASGSLFKRPVVKIALIPTEEDESITQP